MNNLYPESQPGYRECNNNEVIPIKNRLPGSGDYNNAFEFILVLHDSLLSSLRIPLVRVHGGALIIII